MRARFTAAGFSSLALVGCLFYPDIGDLAGASSDGGVTEGAASDGPAPDAPAPDAGRFCAGSTHAFCADFDQGAVGDGWDGTQIDLGSIATSNAQSVSAPSSALAVMPRRASSAPYANALLRKQYPGFAHVVVDLDAYIVAPAWQAGDVNSGMFTISYHSSTVNEGVAVSVGDGYTTVGNPGADSNGAALPTDRWIHLHFDVDPTKSMVATIDGKPFNSTWPALAPGSAPQTVVTIGVNGYNQPAPEYRIYYDNLTIDLP